MGKVDNFKGTESYRHLETDALRDDDGMHKSYTSSSVKIPAWRRKSWPKVRPLTKNLFATGSCWEGEYSFYPMEWHKVLTAPHGRPVLKSSWPAPMELYVFKWPFLYFFLMEERTCNWLVKKERESGRGWERGKNMIKIYCMNFSKNE